MDGKKNIYIYIFLFNNCNNNYYNIYIRKLVNYSVIILKKSILHQWFVHNHHFVLNCIKRELLVFLIINIMSVKWRSSKNRENEHAQ